MQNKLSEIKLFNKLATDEHYGGASEEEYEAIYNKLLGSDIKASEVCILDVGCGPGIHGFRLSKKGYRVYGLDISYEAVKKAKELGMLEGFFVGDIENIPFKDEMFNVCFAGGVLHHLVDLNVAAKELFRITKKGNVVVSFDPNAHHPYEYFHGSPFLKFFFKASVTENERSLTVQELRQAFCQAGFTKIEFSTFQAFTKKKTFYYRIVKPFIFHIIRLLFKEYHKNNMLLMKSQK